MGMDFHQQQHRNMYTTREASDTWSDMMRSLLPLERISSAVDIGCGGGIYAKALADLGIPNVLGMDYSASMLEGAKENCRDYNQISFQQGDALQTGLADNTFDLVLERALIHHIPDLRSCIGEAYRILQSSGYIVIQDRTPADCFLPGDEQHIRGFFFDAFPDLKQIERKRRHDSTTVKTILKEIGFHSVEEVTLWEVRRIYEQKSDLLDDLKERTGRSILHELDDAALHELVTLVDASILRNQPIVEKDRWTIWKAIK
ncbi:class I SAM-dependent methyltransferase [Ornithinibacillus gellani]|uniref:class I SAM-dependent methyltransferase n=1 Tax=Ornithinibacillus gellani TaxID=2293253 RepID=UPI000F475768|nr:class I SAM-dependent methyltransferase [Ornithinibacillus gellani]TQS70562.1 class I SAM-dependent methyltransferase [Ornithinibacillus gellani]